LNIEGKRGRLTKRWLDTIENDMRAVGVYVGDMEIKTSRGLEQWWPTPNSWKGEGKEDTLL